jgi:type II secretory ATPase GspE/PulE/Tfp pilus assembly ATPase PilB-like protein
VAAIKIGDILKAKGLITDTQLDIALIEHKVTGGLLGDELVRLGFITAKERAQILAEQSGLEFMDIEEYPIEEEALRLIPKDVADRAKFIPLDLQDGRMSIGVGEPGNISALDTVTRATKKAPKVYIVDSDVFFDVMETAYFFLENPIYKRIDKIIKDVQETGTAGGADIVSMTDMLIMDGIRKNSTDIHITPAKDVIEVFYRIDGVLQYGHCLPKAIHAGLVSRLKILSQLNIAESRLPQDGALTFSFLNKSYDIRVSSVPTLYGENLVLRILTGKTTLLRMDKLGFEGETMTAIRSSFAKPFGIILLTGPTGSGKTTTLYAALREIDLLERNVISIEDPVEYKVSFVKQSQVAEKIGYDFAMAGRNFMRQDPDVVFLGEIRDEETAKIAIRASITGHLVLSTLHTNDAVTAIPRLLDLGADRYMLSSSIRAIITQRLVRKICNFCKEEYTFTDQERAVLKEYGVDAVKGAKGGGCKKCNRTGYSGRTAVGEILIIDDEIRQLIYEGASIVKLQERAVAKGMQLMKNNAMKKVAAGVTTLEEVIRVMG